MMSRVLPEVQPGSTSFYPPLPQPYFPPKLSEDVLKVGVVIDPGLERYMRVELAQKGDLFELDQREMLSKIVENLCSRWKLETPTNFALKLTVRSKLYITEENRRGISNGDVLELSISPSKLTSILFERLEHQQGSTVGVVFEEALGLLCEACNDPTLVHEFVSRGGISLLAGIIESGSFQLSAEPLVALWTSYWRLIDISSTSWDIVPEAVVIQMANYALGRSKSKSENSKALSVALTILEAVVNGSCNCHIVETNVPLEGLIRHLENSDCAVQQQALALMNALFGKVEDDLKKQQTAALLNSKPVRCAIVNTVLRDRCVGVELEHQLHVFQRLVVNVLDGRARSKPSAEKVGELGKLSLGIIGGWSVNSGGASPTSPVMNRRNNTFEASAKDYKKLGFLNVTDPTQDFELAPPGILALDCLSYFAKRHPEKFAKIIIENSCRTDGRDYPFVQTSMHVICRLLTMLNVGEAPQDDSGSYYEVLFTDECAFEELSSHVLVLFSRTWKEMCALYPDDLSTVLQVVEEQVRRSLNGKPRTFDQMEEMLRKHSYAAIARIRENERALKEKNEFESKPILLLQEKLKPEMFLLVRANRLNGLKEGTTFIKYGRGAKGAREKGKFWHWKLSPTEQYLMYEDCEEKVPPKRAEDMKNKLMVSDMERVVVGIDCPHVARETKSKKTGTVMAFSIFLNSESCNETGCFNFVAPCMPTYNMWIDGLFALLNLPMLSNQAMEDVDMLLDMEIKVRLLDLDDAVLPMIPPPVPPPPPNFNF